MRRDREGESHVHAAAVMLHWRVEKFLHLGKGDDFIEPFFCFFASHAENYAVEKDILATR